MGPALAILVIVIIGIVRLGPGVSSTPFHRDEARWIGNSALLGEWRHPLGSHWQDEGYQVTYGSIDESNRRRSQPPLAMYLIGIGLVIQGEGLQQTGYWIMSQDADWNASQGHLPSQSELTAARRTNVALAIATAILLCLIGSSLIGTTGGLLAGVIYVIHPLVLSTSTRAWSDPSLVLCIVLAGYAALHFGRRPTVGRAALVGICLGLGGAAKLSPLILAAGFGALAIVPVIGAIFGRVDVQSAMRAALRFTVVPVSAFATFVTAYPYLWTDPIGHTKRMFEFRSLSFDLQRAAFPPARVADNLDALERIRVQLTERFSVGGYLPDNFGRWLDDRLASWARDTDLVLALAGFLLLVAVIAHRRFPMDDVMPLLVLGGQAALIVASYHLDYSRYLLPVLPLMAIAIASVIALPAAHLFSRLEKWSQVSNTTARNESAEEPIMDPG